MYRYDGSDEYLSQYSRRNNAKVDGGLKVYARRGKKDKMVKGVGF